MLKFSVFAAGVAAAGLFSLSPASAQEADAAAEGALQEAPRCVRLVNVNGYSVIDSEHVLFRGSVNRRYLATMRTRCSDLRFGARLATSFGPRARICNPSLEYITTSDGSRCLIERIEEVESLDAARALIEARAAAEDGATGSR